MPTTPKKTTKSESGHAKNAANFGALIATIEGYGASYKPTLAAITVAKLKSLKLEIDKSLRAVSAAAPPYKTSVNKRQEAFDGMSKLATRVLNALAVVGTAREAADARGIVNRIRGGGKSKKVVKLEASSEAAPKSYSSSQMSYDNRVKNFRALVDLLNGIPAYKPNEADLKTTYLNKYLDALPGMGEAVNKSLVALNNARKVRDGLLYGAGGALGLSKKAKSYLKSLYGAASSEYKRVAKIELKT